MAGQRRLSLTGAGASSLGLFRHFKGIVHFYTEVSDRALELRMPQKKLYCTQVLGASIYQCRFRPPEGMGGVVGRIQSERIDGSRGAANRVYGSETGSPPI
jgi:hypothetical protein